MSIGHKQGTEKGGWRYLKSCVVEIPDSIAVDIPHLPEKHFPILPDVTKLRFEHGASHKRCTIERKQVPTEPGFAITVYKAQGKTMERVIVDLASCSGTEQPYVMILRAISLDGLMVLRDLQAHQIKRRSEELQKEFSRLLHLKWRTIARYGMGAEVKDAKVRVEEDGEKTRAKGTKRKGGSGDGGKSKRKRT